MAPNTTTDTIPEKASNEQTDELTQQTAAMAVSRAIEGFFDLPGDLQTLSRFVVSFHGREYRQIIDVDESARSLRVHATIEKYVSFLLLFVGQHSASGLRIQFCNIEVCNSHGCRNPTIDSKWLLELLYAHSEVNIKFQNRDQFVGEAADLNKVFEMARINPAWRSRLADFDAVSLEAYNSISAMFPDRDSWKLVMVIEREAAANW
ncbi:hypothetical protein FB567DRAFT_552853 [Paraphoma chrysanthemicola]|uniref:Uncharacterized protein n=1 Tax=Paraphoma chrysanthemicola TaxID=798071 RepID=A0A8K0R062_9PLEO|nr:hypothetical protein FB567DRAFT_552853 [Paraphoma chrysanthemicola]